MEIDKYSIGFVAPSPRNSNKGWTYSPMETLKSAVPDALKQEISNSTPSQLPSTCSSLLHFFHKLPQFHQVLSPLFSTTFFGQNSAILFTLCFFFFLLFHRWLRTWQTLLWLYVARTGMLLWKTSLRAMNAFPTESILTRCFSIPRSVNFVFSKLCNWYKIGQLDKLFPELVSSFCDYIIRLIL